MLTRKLFRDSLYVFIFVELTYTLSTAVDGIIISRVYASNGIAAMGLARPIFSILAAIAGLISLGLQSRCSNYLGKGDIESAKKVFAFMFNLAVIVSVMIAVSGIIFSESLTDLFGGGDKSSALWNNTREYTIAVLIGAPALILIPVLSSILHMDSDPKLVRCGVFVMTFVNAAGDILNGYVLNFGMFGMGLATTIANYFALFLMMFHFFRKDSMFRLRISFIKFSEIMQILSGGAPVLTKRLCKVFRPILINRFIFAVGTERALAAYSIQNNFIDIMMVFGAGIVSTALLLGGVFFSERDAKSLDELAYIAFRRIIFMVIPCSVLVFIFAPEIAKFYLPNSVNTVGMAVMALRAMAIAVPLQTLADTLISMQQAVSNMKFVHVFTVLNRFVLVLSCLYALGYTFGVPGIWAAFPVSAVLLVILELAVICIVNRKIISSYIELYSLKEHFAYSNVNYIEASLSKIEDAVELSSNVIEFCTKHDIDEERRYRFTLCIEEMGINVITHGFKDGKKHEVNARVIYDNGDLIFRLRDNCGTFNIKERAQNMAESAPEKGIGIKLTMASAKDVQYVHVLKTNTIIITV